MLDAARIQVLQRQLTGIAEEMGARLVRSAVSVNIKERRDSSCAIFDSAGRLVAQAAHVPVHLGSMQHAVEAVIEHHPAPGEVWMLNDPYEGGTHLPDITVVGAVHDPDSGALVGYAAVRAHHADVGGRFPGSLSIDARTIDDEGVRVTPVRVARDGRLDQPVLDRIVRRMRQPQERMADIAAQVAALDVAARRLPTIATGWGGAAAYERLADQLLDHAERRCRSALEPHVGAHGHAVRALELPPRLAATTASSIACEVRVGRGSAGEAMLDVDLRASSPQSASSLNCPLPVTAAAVTFAVRCAFDPDLPWNGGVERAIRIATRPGTLVHAVAPAAVAAGNVEVSSVLVDVLLDALSSFVDVPADGQGTMNNLVIGNDRFSSYETIAGGQGASRHAPGPSAVHVAMTNTRNTPVEVLEHEMPLEVVRYEVRRGSGGAGLHRGGDGVVRAIRVLEPCTVSLVSQRRDSGPSGRAGGGDGAPGVQRIDGEPVPGSVTHEVERGSVVEVETPGGGGWGAPVGSGT